MTKSLSRLIVCWFQSIRIQRSSSVSETKLSLSISLLRKSISICSSSCQKICQDLLSVGFNRLKSSDLHQSRSIILIRKWKSIYSSSRQKMCKNLLFASFNRLKSSNPRRRMRQCCYSQKTSRSYKLLLIYLHCINISS